MVTATLAPSIEDTITDPPDVDRASIGATSGTTTAGIPVPTTDTPDADSATTADERPGDGVSDDYDRIHWVPPTSLRIGPNIREDDLEPTREEVADYKAYGVEDPIKVYRDDVDGILVVLKGQRRTLTAVKACVELVPVWMQPPPSEDEKQAAIERITAQYRWTRHRRDHTRRDTFRAIEQLRLFGLSVTAITKRLSVPRREVADTLKVGNSELAAAAADRYALNLEQAAEIAEWEKRGDLDAAKKLITTAAEGPHNFTTLAGSLRRERAEAERLGKLEAACTEQLNSAGVPILDTSITDTDWGGRARSLERLRPSPDHEPDTALTPDEHARCPGHSAWIQYEFDDNDKRNPVPVYACSDFRTHGHALLSVRAGWVDYNTPATSTDTTRGAMDGGHTGAAAGDSGVGHGSNSDAGVDVSTPTDSGAIDAAAEAAAAYAAHLAEEAERRKAAIRDAWLEENTRLAEAAQEDRQKWLQGFARRKTIPKGARKWLALRILSCSAVLDDALESGHPLAHRLLGLPEPELVDNYWNVESVYGHNELHELIDNTSDAKAAVYELFLVLCAYEEALRTDSWRTPTETDQVYIRMLIDLGYQAPDIDRKVLDPDNIDDIIAAALADSNQDDSDEHAEAYLLDARLELETEPHNIQSDQPTAVIGDSDNTAEASTDEAQVSLAADHNGQPSSADLAA